MIGIGRVEATVLSKATNSSRDTTHAAATIGAPVCANASAAVRNEADNGSPS
jgi:hypothetical protein